MNAITTTSPTLAEHAHAIRCLGNRAKEDLIEIGRRLVDAKRLAGHGRWLTWLDQELGWTEKTAQRFIKVYEFSQADIFKYDKLSNLEVPVSAIYLLAAPSTPNEARESIIERARNGESVPVVEVKRVIETAKGRAQPAARSKKAPEPDPPPPPSDEERQRLVAFIRANFGRECEHLRARVEELENEKRRLEIENTGLRSENTGLRSEIEELKARTGRI
jgi:hypothetical protein